ncbi:MAG TPA: hypothetical protein VFN38_10715, partial [Gemmatimonadaceae bacterium]|nr:hypothetical protein [Gemmatimonadaceae bacterium]
MADDHDGPRKGHDDNRPEEARSGKETPAAPARQRRLHDIEGRCPADRDAVVLHWRTYWRSIQSVDDPDQLVSPIPVLARELRQLARLLHDRPMLGGCGNGHAAAAPELEDALVAQLSQRAQHGVPVDLEDGRQVAGRRQAFSGLRLALGYRAPDLGGHLLVQVCWISAVDLDIYHGATDTSSMATLTPSPPSSEDHHDAEALEALIEEARQRARRRRRKYTAAALAAGLVGAYGLGNIGGDDTRSSDRGELAAAEAGAAAQITDGKWRVASGLEGGEITTFAVDPKQPKTVFAATWEAGVFKSVDGGRRWRHMDVGSEVSHVDAIAIAPGDTQTVYVGTGRGVYKTTNGGRSWERTSAGILGKETAAQRGYRPSGGYVSALIVDPRDADVAYAGTRENGLFKTEDGGGSWRRVGPKSVRTLAFQPGRPDVVYATAARGVYRSRDGGATWQPAGLQSFYLAALAVDPKHPHTIYAGTYEEEEPDIVTGRIFKTTDGGASWRRTKGVRDVIGAIAIDPHNTDVVYAEAGGNVVKTADGGRTWRSLGAGLTDGPALALDPRNPETIYRGAAGVAKSVDGGRSWRRMNAGLTTARVPALAVAPGSRGRAYAAVHGRGVFKRVDGTWRLASTLPTDWFVDTVVNTVAVDPRHAANVYASTNGAFFRSANGGATWSESPLPALFGDRDAVSALAVDPKNSRTVYALAVRDATTGDGLRQSYESLVMKSTDGGRTWPTRARVRAVDFPAALA